MLELHIVLHLQDHVVDALEDHYLPGQLLLHVLQLHIVNKVMNTMINELKEIDNRKFKYMEQWLARKMVIFESMNTMVQEMEVVANMKFKQMENSFG